MRMYMRTHNIARYVYVMFMYVLYMEEHVHSILAIKEYQKEKKEPSLPHI